MTTRVSGIAAALGKAITQRIGEPRYQLWFENNTRFRWESDQLIVGVPNHFYQEWLQKTFTEMVRAAASEVFGKAMQVRFVIDPELFRAVRQSQEEIEQAARTPGAGSETALASPKTPLAEPSPTERDGKGGKPAAANSARAESPRRTRRWLRLEEFVVGPCNRLAHAAALSVVEMPGHGPNPLVLHGPVGTGKTHLLEGIYVGLRRARPDWRICPISSEEFTNRFLAAMNAGKLGSFRKHYRECDALLIDDLQFLATKRATQEEFLHTFDILQADGKQVVLACDCHPRLADDYTPELTDRLVGGSVWGLTPPDEETRLNILRARAAQGEPALPENVLRHLAGQLRGNVRELVGAVHSLRHYARVTARPIDLGLAREALGDLLRHAVRVVQLADIDQAICRVLRLPAGTLQSKQRSWAVSHPRMLAIYLARKHTTAAYSEIGDHFGGRNHSTAVAAEKKVRQWLQGNQEMALGERRLRVRDLVELVERELQR